MVDAKRAIEVLEEELKESASIGNGACDYDEALTLAIAALKAQGEPVYWVVDGLRKPKLEVFDDAALASQFHALVGGRLVALYTAPQPAMRIPRLSWVDESDIWSFAKTEFGQYNVDLLHGAWRLSMPPWMNEECWNYPTKAEAQSAAQADYDKRAMACFEPQPESQPAVSKTETVQPAQPCVICGRANPMGVFCSVSPDCAAKNGVQPAQAAPDGWQPIETAPKDRLIEVYAPEREGLNEVVSLCQWHDSAGFCICELRVPTHWRPFAAPAPGGE